MRRRGRRGYSVVELAVVAVVATGIILGLVRWLVGVGTVAHSSIRQAAGGELLLAQAQLRDDLQTVRFCTANGTDARVREVGPATLVLIGDPDGDQDVEATAWRIEAGQLQRSVAALGPGCATPVFSGWTTWASGLIAGSRFTVVADGATVTDGTGGPCSNEFEARCAIDAVGADLERDGVTAEMLDGVFDVAGGRDVITIGSLTGQLVPGRVAGVAVDAGNAQAVVTWEQPSTSGWAITDYTVEYSVDAGTTWQAVQDGASPATSATINGLANGVVHQFRIAAVNVNGTGATSAPVSATPFPPAGTVMWAARGGGEGFDAARAVTSSGSLVLAGGSYSSVLVDGVLAGLGSATGDDAFVAAVNAADGAAAWRVAAGGPGQQQVHGLATGAGAALVTGSYESTSSGFLSPLAAANGSDAFVASLSAGDGAARWVLRGGGDGDDASFASALSSDGAVAYAVGTYAGTPTGFLAGVGASAGSGDAFVAAFDAVTGEVRWRVRGGGAGNDAAMSVAIDPTGDTVYVAGHYAGQPTGFIGPAGISAGGDDAFVAALDAESGQVLWVRRGGGSGEDQALAVFADAASVYAGGLYNSNATGFLAGLGASTGAADSWLLSLSRATGSLAWISGGGSSGGSDSAAALLAAHGRLYAGGSYGATPNGFLSGMGAAAGALDVFAAGVDAGTGSAVWASRGGSTQSGSEAVTGIDASAAGWLYLTGFHLPEPTGLLTTLPSAGGDMFILMVSPGPVDSR